MYEQQEQLDALQDIKQMMNKSSRFISLSGLSGVAAGVCALAGAWFANKEISKYSFENSTGYSGVQGTYIFKEGHLVLAKHLAYIGVLTFLAALLLSFLFTYVRSRQAGVAIWGYTARRLIINVAIPMIAGALLIWRMMDFGLFGLIAPACLLFYGVALINASKYTLKEIRYLGYCMLILGALNLWMLSYGIYFWAMGFGVLHIIYGILMWNKYERINK
jgi:hypothetical protein